MTEGVVNLGDYVVLREITGAQKLIHIKEGSQVFYIGKYSIKGSDIIGREYYTTLSLEDGRWEIGSTISSEEVLRDILNEDKEGIRSDFSEESHIPPTNLTEKKRVRFNPLLGREIEAESENSSVEDEILEQGSDSERVKRKRNEILMESKGNDGNLIRSLALSSASFKNKTNFSKEKYIKKLQLRYLKHLVILPCTLLNVTETLSCQPNIRSDKLSPNSVGPRWGQCTVRIETIGNILTHGHIHSESRVLLYDNLSNGLVGGSIYRHIKSGSGTGGLFDISMNKLTFDTIEGHFNGKLALNFEALSRDPNPKTSCYSIPISALEAFYKMRTELSDFLVQEEYIGNLNIQHEWLNTNINTNSKSELSLEKSQLKKKRIFNRIQVLESLYSQGADTVILVIDQVKWQSCAYNANKTKDHKEEDAKREGSTHFEGKAKYFDIQTLIQTTQEYLSPGGKLVIFTPFMTTELLQIHQDLILSTRVEDPKFRPFVGIKLEETFIREHQIIPQRTHPTMDANLPIFSGFLLSAIRIT
ncbi:eukaryotic initiation factor 3, gamma subunit protein [Cryptosporidium felis]|nr:eukaryotic initiation factor 3, gamma subunit protein [Cryptosporidium felis]